MLFGRSKPRRPGASAFRARPGARRRWTFGVEVPPTFSLGLTRCSNGRSPASRREVEMIARAFFEVASLLRLQGNRFRHSVTIILAAAFMAAAPTAATAADPKGQLTWGFAVSFAPTW